MELNFGELPFRNCLKSPTDARNVASRDTRAAPFCPFWSRYTSQIHARISTRTPFQAVSWRTSRNLPSTHSGEYRDVEEHKFLLAVLSLMVPYNA